MIAPSFRIRLTTALALSIAALGAHAAPQTWGVQFGNGLAETTDALVSDGQGGTFWAGYSQFEAGLAGSGGVDVLIRRTASDGSLTWTAQLGTVGTDYPGGLVPDGAGGVFVAGTSTVTGFPEDQQGLLARLDGQGNWLWAVYLGTAQADSFGSLASDGAGGVIAVGSKRVSNGGSSLDHLWAVRFDATGAVLWNRSHALPGDVYVRDAVADGQGGVFVGGAERFVVPPFSVDFDGFVCRLSSTGDLVWTRALSTVEDDEVLGVAVDASGGVYAVGRTQGVLAPSNGGQDIVAARYDGAGSLLWLKQLGTGSTDYGTAACEDGVGGVVLAAYTGGALAGTQHPLGGCALLNLDPAGATIWSDQFGSSLSLDVPAAVCMVGPQTVVAAGRTNGALFGSSFGSWDAWLASRDVCQPQPPTNYCVTSPNSAGPGATIALAGTTDLSYDDLELSVAGCPPGEIGVFLLGSQSGSVPFGDGVLCLSGSILRLLPGQTTDASGNASLPLDPENPNSAASQITPGSTWNFQFWYRDPPAGGAQFNLSDALSATFCP